MRSPFLKVLLVSFLLLSAAGARSADPSANAQGPKERAAASLEQDLKADPNNAELWLHLGFAYRKLEKLDQAKSAFEKASSLDPRNQESLYMLGLIYEKEKRTDDALRTWKQYLSVASDEEKRGVAENHIHHLSQ